MLAKCDEKIALVCGEIKISYKELKAEADYYSKLFDKEKTEKIAIFSENRVEWIYSFYAGWKNGVVNVPIDYLSTADEVAYILNDCKPEVLFCSGETRKTLDDVLPKLTYEIKVVQFESVPPHELKSEYTEFPEFDKDDVALIIYTSGTTGSPKGVMLTYENVLVNVDAVTVDSPIYSVKENVLVLLPLHHVFPLLGTVACPLKVGSTIAMSPSLAAEDVIKTLQDNKITIMVGVPRFYELLRKGVKDKINKKAVARAAFKVAQLVGSKKFSKKVFKEVHDKFGGHVKYLVCGGAALDKEAGRDYDTLGFSVLEGYGMTECGPMITFPRPEKVRLGSCGQLLLSNEIKVVDGEILTKGPNVMKGYYNKPDETNEVLKDGWLHTGDLGHFDEDGFLFITGRKKELIILSNGKNINPEEIEIKILEGNDVIDEIGVYEKNDKINAVLVPNLRKIKEKGIANIEDYFRWEIIDKYNNKSAPYKKITSFALTNEELPRTRLGKLRRFKLQDLATGKTAAKKEEKDPTFEEYGLIKNFIIQQKGTEVFPSDHFEIDLGLDSLDRVTFQVFLKTTFGLDFNDSDFAKYPTVIKLSEHIKENKTKMVTEEIDWAAILKEKVKLDLPKSWVTFSIIKMFSKFLLKIYFRLRAEGMEKLPEGPCIIAPNHQSFFDGLFVTVFLKNKLLRQTYFYAKEKHIRKSWVKFVADRHNVIVMDLNKDLKESLQKMAEVLKKGKNIIIFPEGTRTKNGKIGDFKKTFAILSRELNVPVVPVAIKGAFNALPRGSKIPRPFKKISVKFLDPIYPSNSYSYEKIRDLVYERIVAAVTKTANI